MNSNGSDIIWLIEQMKEHYAYLPDRHVDLARLRTVYVHKAQAARDARSFLSVLEEFLAEFHDHHIEAQVNTTHSFQLVPTGTDIWAEMREGRAMIDQVKPFSAAWRDGIKIGDEVIAIGGVPVKDAISTYAPRCLSQPDPEAQNYTLRVLLAGRHDTRRVFRIVNRTVDLPSFVPEKAGSILTHKKIADTGYIRIENSLGDTALVGAFDAALDALNDAKAFIVDLRNTPSGGTTATAEPIMARFITGRPDYQRVFDPGPRKVFPRDSWARWVRARGVTITQKLVVLVDRWTASMGEGMAIGFDGMKRATVIGTPMAGLCGATDGFMLPASRIVVQFPTERLYHLDNTPRERWVPPVSVDLAASKGDDPILARALETLD